MGPEEFVEALSIRFPRLDLDDAEITDLFYMQVGRFGTFCQEAIDSSNKTLVLSCFEMADQGSRTGTKVVTNAVGVAFVEHLNFVDGKVLRRWAFDLLPPSLKAMAESLGNVPL